jgi:hypothetical protein
MSRVNVYAKTDLSDYDGYGFKPELLGWFDPAKAERFDQDTQWDGNNVVGVLTGSQWVDEYLYRTSGDRWVRNHDATRYCNGPDTYEFLTDEQAKDWLLRSGNHDDVIERFFGEVEEEKGPGRPGIGGPVHVRLGAGNLSRVDAWAEAEGISRAEWVRRAVEAAVMQHAADELAAR